jgi:hypothetical protein
MVTRKPSGVFNMTPYEAYSKCLEQNKRILELEDIISTDSQYSYYYVLYIIQKPWKQGEKTISKHPRWSYFYANYIIQGPFDKCHPIIFNSYYKDEYIKFLTTTNYDLNKISEWLI